MLSDGDKGWLVVRGGVDGSKAVSARRKAVRNLSSQNTVDSLAIETQKEVELCRVCRLRVG